MISEEINCTKPSPSVSVPCSNIKFNVDINSLQGKIENLNVHFRHLEFFKDKVFKFVKN